MKAKPFPIHVRRPGLLAILALFGASGVVDVKAETFPFQIYGSAPAGLARLSGFTDTIPDVVGRIDLHASLVIFSEGNHFSVLLPLSLDGFREWMRPKGHALRNDNVVVVTLPQPMLVSALERGGIAFGAAVVPVDRRDGLWPDQKNYQLLTKPRHQMRTAPHRNNPKN